MKGIFSDVITATQMFGKIRSARRAGENLRIEATRSIPCIKLGVSFLDTAEGCTLWNCGNDIFQAASDAFRVLPYEQKYDLAFTPQSGKLCERAHFWQELLRPVMSPAQYGAAMHAILSWYRHIKQTRGGWQE